ncbi:MULTISPECIES: enoyl-CoA hydratase/isomerase family protein [Peribacillus]|uniref:Enoyl-CoA hydratase n=1 Tax=Peribacillus butanolivorans TaxID=421767 RepID=A0ABN5N9M6_9BACI|nr:MULTISPECIES: enoyl-CoA hydratase [Peribacillus]AXN40320.1 enoyl-CoA hydratase [Peribacillus butanolivorans]MBK5459609.1 enoyl-CoA hydratase [Peribacillus sp. TH27]MBK5481418.1 enoyl-CoA hydratase [Peribacillus sp. TH16]QNU05792.1 enoyl-CoA hydratase [Peribacillus butanolivorans]WMX57074.1 enoyl-CoA hydratase [Peribacillus sp. R9-11]
MRNLVRVEKENKLAIVTIDNPPLNVISKNVFKGLLEVFTELEEDNETVAVLITGAGDIAFAAGADIKEFPQMMGNPNMKETVRESHAILNKIDHFPKPTIAVLNGMTLGGGCELALACDLRVAEAQVQIGLPEVKLGLFPGAGGTQRLSRLVGNAKAKEIIFTGDSLNAKEAEKIGLVNKVVEQGCGLTEAKNLASRMTRHSLQALSRIKKAINEGSESTLEQGLEIETNLFEEIFQTEDVKEGVSAFLDKRKPAFLHR